MVCFRLIIAASEFSLLVNCAICDNFKKSAFSVFSVLSKIREEFRKCS